MNDGMAVDDVKNRMMMVRGEVSLLDRDVAALYGVTTKEVNQAVRNNPDKFMPGYVYELSQRELENLRSKILTAELNFAVVKITHEVTRKRKQEKHVP